MCVPDLSILRSAVLGDKSYNLGAIVARRLHNNGISRDLFDGYFGGVTLFPCNIFKQINGYSNKYYGWGFEDDDLFLRCLENNIMVNSVKIPQFSRNSVGLSFNGKDSFVAIPNTLISSRDFTIFTSFRFDSINRNPENITDNNSIFSIPGFDTTLTVDSFFDIIFQFWKKNHLNYFQKSKKASTND